MMRFILTILALCATWCRAAIVPELTLDQLVAGSECIIQGTVVRSWSAWDERHHFIWTHHEVLIRDRWKQSSFSANPTLVLSEPGGTVRSQTMQVGGAALYGADEGVVVFLASTPLGYLRAIGNGQGKFTITQAAGSPEKYIHSDLSAVKIVPGGPQPSGPGTVFPKLNGMSLEELRRTVLRLVARRPPQ